MDPKGNKFSRGELILTVCDKDGGAHVDPELEKKYYQLSRENSLGWKYSSNGKWSDFTGCELASIRQMAHEVILTFKNEIPWLIGEIDSNAISEVLNPRNSRGDLHGLSVRGVIIDVCKSNAIVMAKKGEVRSCGNMT